MISNVGSGNGCLVPSGNMSLPDPMLTQFCRHMASLGHNELSHLRAFWNIKFLYDAKSSMDVEPSHHHWNKPWTLRSRPLKFQTPSNMLQPLNIHSAGSNYVQFLILFFLIHCTSSVKKNKYMGIKNQYLGGVDHKSFLSPSHSLTSNGSWRQGIKGEMTCTVYVALVWNNNNNDDDDDDIYWIMMIIIIIMMMMMMRMTMMIIGTTTIMIIIIIITTTLTKTIMKMIMINTAQTPWQSLYKDRRI